MLSSTHHGMLFHNVRCDSSKIHPSCLGQNGHVRGRQEGRRSMRKENNQCGEKRKTLFFLFPFIFSHYPHPEGTKWCATTYSNSALVLGYKQVIVLLWVRCSWTSNSPTAVICRPAHKGRRQAWTTASLVLNLKQEGCAGRIGVIAESSAPFQRKLHSHLMKS